MHYKYMFVMRSKINVHCRPIYSHTSHHHTQAYIGFHHFGMKYQSDTIKYTHMHSYIHT